MDNKIRFAKVKRIAVDNPHFWNYSHKDNRLNVIVVKETDKAIYAADVIVPSSEDVLAMKYGKFGWIPKSSYESVDSTDVIFPYNGDYVVFVNDSKNIKALKTYRILEMDMGSELEYIDKKNNRKELKEMVERLKEREDEIEKRFHLEFTKKIHGGVL